MQEDKIYKNGSIKNVNLPAITTSKDGNPPRNSGVDMDKKRTKFGILKLAKRLVSSNSGKKKPQAVTAAPAQWEKIVGSMRPLHLQENLQSPTASTNESPRDFSFTSDANSPSPSFHSKKSGNGTMSQYESAVNLQDLDQPTSQYGSSESLQDMDVPMSQYGSARNLQELDAPMSPNSSVNNLQRLAEGEEDKDPVEDEMIDLKAEEFIALFYQKMRLEKSNRNQNYRGRQWVL